jgi:hypothetical protein
MKNYASSNTKIAGLKKAIANYTQGCRAAGPQHKCDNCKQVRYVPCTCMRKNKDE